MRSLIVRSFTATIVIVRHLEENNEMKILFFDSNEKKTYVFRIMFEKKTSIIRIAKEIRN